MGEPLGSPIVEMMDSNQPLRKQSGGLFLGCGEQGEQKTEPLGSPIVEMIDSNQPLRKQSGRLFLGCGEQGEQKTEPLGSPIVEMMDSNHKPIISQLFLLTKIYRRYIIKPTNHSTLE